MRNLPTFVTTSCFVASLFALSVPPALADPVHAAAMHGKPAYGKDFTHFDYVNPDAPKGGNVTLSAIGSFDSFNPFVVKGNPASGIALLYDTLTVKSQDEPFSEYGLLAETFEIGENRDWVRFNLNPRARFSDGKPVTTADVAYTFDLLINQGNPFYRGYYGSVDRYEIHDQHSISFLFKNSNPELALILGQLRILPKHFWESRDFNAALTEPPVGSGPYTVGTFDFGRSVTYLRNADYWGKNLPVNKGKYNFAKMTYTYFLDGDVAMEAFKSHAYDFRKEYSSTNWATEYNFPAIKSGEAKKEAIKHNRPTGMQAFVFNTRREIFKDVRVRQALAYAFDFEWSNANLFHGAYARTKSYFENSELASRGLPSEAELALLEPLRDQIPPEVFTTEYQPPTTDGTSLRDNLRQALQLMRQAGWVFKDGALTNNKQEKFTFEILLKSRAMERVVNPMVQNLKRMGIAAKVRVIEITQYANRVNSFDFDMVVSVFGQSNSPGNEQRDYWGSSYANLTGSRNLAGIHNAAVDALIEKVIFASSREGLITACRALDRVLLWNHYVIPQFYGANDRIAWWDNVVRPDVVPSGGVDISTWWAKP